MSEKPTGIEDVPLKKTDTPENQEQKVRKQEENQRQRTDLAAREYFKNAKTDGLTPGETSFERSMDNLALVGIDAADQSYTEISSTENFKNLPEADQWKITEKYTALAKGFDSQIQSLQQKYAGQPNSEDFQKELFDLQRQFERDLGQVAAEANGITNGTFAKKKSADESAEVSEQAIRDKEQKRFSKSLQDMLAHELLLKKAELQSQQTAYAANAYQEARNNIKDFFGLSDQDLDGNDVGFSNTTPNRDKL